MALTEGCRWGGGAGWHYLRGVGVGEGGAQGIRISRQVLRLGSSVAGHGQNQLQREQ